MTPLLEVRRLGVRYRLDHGELTALSDVELDVRPGEIVGVVGESGSGKSTLADSILGLLPHNARVTAGGVAFEGHDLLAMEAERLRALRGARLAAIFQDPLTTLNPAFPIGAQMIDLQRAHGARGRGRRAREERRRRAVAALEEVGIPDASTRIDAHPHTFSGGMRQRVMIATALLLGPALLVADEPTSALDATLVAQVLALLRRTRDERGTAILLISHDLRAVAAISDRVLVMSEGRIVEHGDAVSVLTAPQHPYTRTLLGAMPFRADGVPRSRRNAIEPMR